MKRWAKDEEELLYLWKTQDWSNIDIANELDRTKESVKKKCIQLNIKSTLTNKVYSHTYYEKKVSKVFNVLEPYINSRTKILHECILCKSKYKRKPVISNINKGCKYCGVKNNTGSIGLTGAGIIYLVYIPKYNFYKFGITSKSCKERMKDLCISTYEIILEIKYKNAIDVINLEKQWFLALKPYLVNTELLKSGNTETFYYDH